MNNSRDWLSGDSDIIGTSDDVDTSLDFDSAIAEREYAFRDEVVDLNSSLEFNLDTCFQNDQDEDSVSKGLRRCPYFRGSLYTSLCSWEGVQCPH